MTMMLLMLLTAVFVSFTLFSRNVVYSLVSLVGAFFTSGVLLISLGLEFLGYVLIIVYVGAIAILFIFVVMTLDIQRESFITYPSGIKDYLPHFTALGLSVFVFKILNETTEPLCDPAGLGPIFNAWAEIFCNSNNLAPLYFTLYSSGFPFLFVCGLLLLIAMVGSVFLTQSQQTHSKEKGCTRKPSRSARVGRKR